MPQNVLRRLTKRFLIICNLLASIIFLMGVYGGGADPQRWWFLGFFVLSAFYLLLVLFIFILFWLSVKPVLSLISIITILIAIKPIGNIIPFHFNYSFDVKKKDSAMRLMSWNIQHFDILEHKTHPERKKAMFDLINEYSPDVACFQEMVGSDSVPDAINYIPEIMRELKFPEYNYSYNPKLDFDGSHHFGLITFSKYPVVNKETISFYPNDYNSIFQYTDILKGEDTIRVFNIHLQSLRFSSSNLRYIENPSIKDDPNLKKTKSLVGKFKVGFLKRKTQADRIHEEISKSPYPVIVCGDFNDVPNSYAYNTIGQGMKNAFVQKGTGFGRTFTGISPTLRIDNIFATPEMPVLQFTRINKKLVDHFPIVADLGKD